METRPVKFKQANWVLKGPDGVEDLPVCHTDDGNVCSCWRIPWIKRLKVLLTGRVFLVVRGHTHPPLWIDTECFEHPDSGKENGERETEGHAGICRGIGTKDAGVARRGLDGRRPGQTARATANDTAVEGADWSGGR